VCKVILNGLVIHELFPVEVLSMNTLRLKLLGLFCAIIAGEGREEQLVPSHRSSK
jgi:hypothetical protein